MQASKRFFSAELQQREITNQTLSALDDGSVVLWGSGLLVYDDE